MTNNTWQMPKNALIECILESGTTLRLVQLGGNIYPVTRTISRAKQELSPAKLAGAISRAQH
jgi:hypothetical protein